jgi:predicted DNA-binding protein (UPF0251 family)/phage FluMu protein Com
MKGFKPIGVPMWEVQQVQLHYEEYEAIVLTDYQRLSQAEAAEKMDVSRPTFTRIYDRARQKMAQALAEGAGLYIDGGEVSFDKEWFRCLSCHHVFTAPKTGQVVCPHCKATDVQHINAQFETEQKRGAHGKDRGAGPGGRCYCPQCGREETHKRGVSCNRHRCGTCDVPLQRK